MTLKIYNTKTRQKEVFQPLVADQVKMYVCGPTVYNFVHIGNARPVVVFDTLFRLLQTQFKDVTYARNITDIDDKIMNAAAEQGIEISELASTFAAEFEYDMAELNNLAPSITPYATDHLPEMIAMVEKLIEKGHAYASEGHVLFAVKSMADYGKLSNRTLDDMLDGARVEIASYKKYAGDFVLWKPSADDEPGWASSWGRGRPGWHLECSAMIKKHLGETIDIHGGGRDLIFPHHENEVAQSCCANDADEYVRYWMHNGYINIGGEKMSKSLGNFHTVRDLLKQFKGEVIRFALLSAQYRSEMDFSPELLEGSKSSLDSLYGALRDSASVSPDSSVSINEEPGYLALLDDLSTPIAIRELHQLAKSLNKADIADKPRIKATLLKLAGIMGLLGSDAEEWFTTNVSDDGIAATDIEALILERTQAKKDRDFARSDAIRDDLLAQNIVLEDSREGTKWRRQS
jgi:cysteinyl-tRNA synthetase